MNRYFMAVEKDGIQLSKNKKKLGKPVKDVDELVALLGKAGYSDSEDIVMCSSSMDFPREYTDDEAVIALADKIRGG